MVERLLGVHQLLIICSKECFFFPSLICPDTRLGNMFRICAYKCILQSMLGNGVKIFYFVEFEMSTVLAAVSIINLCNFKKSKPKIACLRFATIKE